MRRTCVSCVETDWRSFPEIALPPRTQSFPHFAPPGLRRFGPRLIMVLRSAEDAELRTRRRRNVQWASAAGQGARVWARRCATRRGVPALHDRRMRGRGEVVKCVVGIGGRGQRLSTIATHRPVNYVSARRWQSDGRIARGSTCWSRIEDGRGRHPPTNLRVELTTPAGTLASAISAERR